MNKIKNPKNVFGISFPSRELLDWAKAEARKENRSLSNFVNTVVQKERERREKENITGVLDDLQEVAEVRAKKRLSTRPTGEADKPKPHKP